MKYLLYYATLLFMGVSLVHPAPVIDAPWGRVSGKDFTEPRGTASYYGYLGIPYALPPLGERRFSKPQPHPGPGAGQVFDASTPAPACPQPDENLVMSEDCLTLNVYTPASPLTDGKPRSVMVWIHGGGYVAGTALSYTPGRLVTQGDVIVVVIQYRLGILGFLSSGDDVAPGNWGLMDQNLAIKWVKDNIRAFGGGPDSITIYGESAGGGSVGFQHLSPYSTGTGHSGTSLVPVVDGDFVPRDPAELVLDPDYLLGNGVLTRDVLHGVNNNEAVTLVGIIARLQQGMDLEGVIESIQQEIPENEKLSYEDFIRDYLQFLMRNFVGKYVSNDEAALGAMAEVVNFFYIQPKVNGEIPVQRFADLLTDTNYVVPLVYVARGLEKSKAQIQERAPGSSFGRNYVYLFDHYPQNNGEKGMSHGSDLAYVFDPSDSGDQDQFSFADFVFTSEDFALAESFVSMLTEFAKTGNPNAALKKQLKGREWPEFSTAGESYLALAPQPRVETDLYAKRVALWLDLIPTLVNYTHAQDHMTHATWSSRPVGTKGAPDISMMMWGNNK